MLPSIPDIRRQGKKVTNPDGSETFPSTDPFTGKRILRTQSGRKGRRPTPEEIDRWNKQFEESD